MLRSLIQRGGVATGASGALLLIMMTLLSNKCSGNPITTTDSPRPAVADLIEIAGMLAFYSDDRRNRNLGIVVNEYEYDETAAILGKARLGFFRLGDASKHIVRQSICYDTNKQYPEQSEFEITRNCVERPKDGIIDSENLSIAMIEELVRQMDVDHRPIFEYRYTDSEDLLDFDLQLRPYSIKNKWSENVTIRRSDWNCLEEPVGNFDCLWQPKDAEKRKVKGLTL